MEQYTIKMTYHTQSRNVVTECFVDPYYLIPRENRFYLLAYCHTKRKVITFRVSRIQSLEWTKKRFQRGDFDIKKYFAKTWSIMSGEDEIHFKVWFSSNIARYIKEEELFVQPKITEQKDGSIIFAVTLNDDREFL